MFRVGTAYADLQNETLAKEADINLGAKLTDLQYNPQNGYYTLRGRDAVTAYQGVYGQAMDAYRQARSTLPNPRAQEMFDQVAVRRVQYAQERMASHAAGENKNWIVQTGEARIQNEINNRSLGWNDPQNISTGLGTIADEAEQRANVLGESPEKTQADITHYKSEFLTSVIRQAMAAETAGTAPVGTAQNLIAQYRPQMDAVHAATLDEQVQNRKYLMDMRAINTEQRNLLYAERQMRETQANTYSQAWADQVQGKPWGPDQIANLVRTRQLSPEMGNALLKGGGSRDDPHVVLELQTRALRGEDVTDDLARYAENGDISGATAARIAKTWVSARARNEDKLVTHNFSALRTAMGWTADMHPIFDMGDAERAKATNLWVQAQQEWSNRVIVKGEDSTRVLADMLAEYARPNQAPSWPQPKYGAVKTPEDVSAVAQKTKEAFTNGEITEGELAHQANLLKLYNDFLLQEQAKAAARAANPLKPNAGGAGAKLKGVQPQEQQ